ncbi:amidohydrolase family protein [Herbiconiux sp. VKM Ac-1786]|uniref:amidohydrolase family protein n=1 Tax=Herbiconiux sp. VKM Ac-1786 TaxID=2783824 RepID=UPI001889D0FB|nr:amidohydrolase family protein [Herbiconiux sp. VKM Ac-1786]MBF4574329.1 amidohydrolase family protein [Herbiconiux sp. VKM Ac-1786]
MRTPPPSPTLWRNALVIALDEAHGATPFRADVLVEGTDIRAVADVSLPGRPVPSPGTTVIDASGLLLTPGLVNAHTHSWEILLRGTSAPLPLEVWTLLSYPPTGVAPVPSRLIHLRTVVAALESLRGGATTLLDDTGELPGQTPAGIAEVFRAYDATGIRATCTGTGIDVPVVDRLPFADEVLPAEVLAASRDSMPPSAVVQEAFFAFSAEARMLARPYPRIRYALSPSAPQRVTDEFLVRAADQAREHGEVLHTHLLETKLQQTLALSRYPGRTIVEHLDALGVLGPNLTVAHGIWLTPHDLELLAASGATVAHNPVSNLKLGSGTLPWRAMHDAGARVALGSDGASSNDTMRMLDVLKQTALAHTLGDPDYRRWPLVSEVLHAGTVAGARAAGWGDRTGSLTPGLAADLVVYDLAATTAFTPLNDAAQQLVFAENGASIAEVWVDGRCVLRDGRSTLVDEEALLAEFRAEAAAYLGAQLPEWRRLQESLEPAIREAYLRAWASAG